MIKINSILFRTFSTIKFPEKYIIKYRLNNQFRSCTTLKQINFFIRQNRSSIEQFSKTQILEYLNEYSLGYDSTLDLQGFAYVLSLENLNIYEEQLRYKILFKIRQYTKTECWNDINLIKWGDQKILEKISVSPFDLVDSINFLVMRAFKKHILVEHSLSILNKIPVENYKSMFSKCLRMILKRMDELEWTIVRKNSQILEYICYKNFISKDQDVKSLIEISERLASLQLQNLGYDTVPISLDHNIQILIAKVDNLDNVALQTFFKMFQVLPLNYYSSVYQILSQKIFKLIESDIIFLHMLPVSRMTVQEINKLAVIYVDKWLQNNKIPYFINQIVITPLLYHQKFIKKMEDLLFKPTTRHRNAIKIEFIGYLGIFIKLWHLYVFDVQKRKLIKSKFIEKYQLYKKEFGLSSLMHSISLVNIFHCLYINQKVFNNIYPNRQLKDLVVIQIDRFLKKKNTNTWKTFVNYSQLEQVMSFYMNSDVNSIKTLLYKVIWQDIYIRNNYDINFGIHMICSIQNSKNELYFANIVHKIYSYFTSNDCLVIADYYIMYKNKTVKSTIKIIQRIWTKNKYFIPIGKIIAHTDWIYIEKEERKLTNQIEHILNVYFQLMKREDIQQYSFEQIYSLLRFGRFYLDSMSSFMVIFTQFVVESLNHSPKLLLKDKDVLKSYSIVSILIELVDVLKIKQEKTLKILNQFVLQMQLQSKDNSCVFKVFKIDIIKNKSVINMIKCQNESEQICEKLNNQNYQFSNNSKQKLYLLKLCFQQKLFLSKQGILYLQRILKQSLKKQQIFPKDIKEAIQTSVNAKLIQNLKQKNELTEMLGELLLFSLIEIKTQQGIWFYYWCLKMSKQFKWLQIVEAILNLLNIFNCEQALIKKIFDILIFFPKIKNKEINRQIVIMMNADHLNMQQCFISISYYINIVQPQKSYQTKYVLHNNLPSFEVQLLKQWQRIQIKYNKYKIIDWTSIITRTYKYLFLSIKNERINEKTIAIFGHCNKYKQIFLSKLQQQCIDSYSKKIFKLVNKYFQVNSQLISTTPTPSKLSKSTTQLFKKTDTINSEKELILFEKQLEILKIPHKNQFEYNGNFYLAKCNIKGIDVQHFLSFNNNNYILFFSSCCLENKNYPLQKIQLFQQLYPFLQNLAIIYYGEQPLRDFLSNQNK